MWVGEMIEVEVAVVVALAIVMLSLWLYRWRRSNYHSPVKGYVLPPGSMGLPLIGETLEFSIPSKSIDIPPFFKKRTQKYGKLFKTNVVGRPVVVSTDVDFNRYILQQEGRLVEMWYLDAFAMLTGHDPSVELDVKPNVTGFIHKQLRNLLLSHVGNEKLKSTLLPELETLAKKTLDSWSTKGFVEMKHETAKMLSSFSAKLVFSCDDKLGEDLAEDFEKFLDGLFSLPINIPGTTFHRSLKAQKKLMEVVGRQIKEGLARLDVEKPRDIFLDHILSEMKTQSFLTVKFITYVIVGLLFAIVENIAGALTLATKLLTENPAVLHELTKEHEEVLRRRSESGETRLTWEEYMSMTYTMQVINEILRLANTVPGIPRRAVTDIHYTNGLIVPKGWTIIIVLSGLHLNPEIYEDPLAFKPSRWEGDEKERLVGKHYIPFGGGGRPCAGAAITKALTAAFLQVLVTKYRWTKVKGGQIIRTPTLVFGDGYYIKVSKKEED